MTDIEHINQEIIECRKCPRLVAWREQVAREKVKRFANEDYWGKPVPGFGDPDAQVLIVGLAPAAHGANRTGRMFTGDRSGEWLYRALHTFGFANQSESHVLNDGLELYNCYITAAVRCAPPANKPAPDEFANCSQFLLQEIEALKNVEIVVCLGKIGWETALKSFKAAGKIDYERIPQFSHGGEWSYNELTFIGSYHPSQQNTFTGKLTQPMFNSIFQRVVHLLGAL